MGMDSGICPIDSWLPRRTHIAVPCRRGARAIASSIFTDFRSFTNRRYSPHEISYFEMKKSPVSSTRPAPAPAMNGPPGTCTNPSPISASVKSFTRISCEPRPT